MGDSAKALEIAEVLDFVLEAQPTANRVVVSQGNDVKALFNRVAEQVNRPDSRFLVID